MDNKHGYVVICFKIRIFALRQTSVGEDLPNLKVL